MLSNTDKQNRFMQVDPKFRHLCADSEAPIIQAMEVIERGKERICFIIDSEDRLLRVVSDGDIRRALLKGHLPSDPVKDIHNFDPGS